MKLSEKLLSIRKSVEIENGGKKYTISPNGFGLMPDGTIIPVYNIIDDKLTSIDIRQLQTDEWVDK